MRKYANYFFSFLRKLAQMKFMYFVAAVIILVIFADNYSETRKTRLGSSNPGYKTQQSSSVIGDVEDISIPSSKIDSLVEYALTLEGIPYQYAGKSLNGFDCSGFTYFVYKKFDIDIPAGSANQYREGEFIREEAIEKGDLLFFTGTEKGSRNVGHVGIVISIDEGDVRFVHSSSGGGGRGVTINSLEHPHYKARFLGAKRVFEES